MEDIVAKRNLVIQGLTEDSNNHLRNEFYRQDALDALHGRCWYGCLIIYGKPEVGYFNFKYNIGIFKVGFKREALRMKSSGRMPLWMI